MKYTKNWLIDQAAGNTVNYLFFWGHRPGKDGAITKSCFSQWWKSSFATEGISYITAEQWMMAGKARLFGDAATLAEILRTDDPQAVKKLGRRVRPFDPAVWDAHKYEVVVQGNLLKFGQDARLKAFLLGTGESVLVEASPYDTVWGIGLSSEAPDVENPRSWNGENLLGFALMEVRDRLRVF